ncbi:Lanthionine synthetase C-like protein [Micromonospora matsumotoense]|uniref:Lanthionine synthetase C-like protein n=1 Tax=Micromonospora matsumotoense TaxID=121616 RepID=A0A1C5AU35_9ACTN|nr:lanthionine synthetase C family protein [Micromonospora matsumotoense]SCF48745.1 Lanthionine synthetase C-like protein [Micromonospora matsumotoense]
MTTPTITANPVNALTAACARLANPSIVDPSPDGRTRPQSLAGGAVGIALLHIERATGGHGDEATADSWIRAAVSEPVSIGRNSDPFHGAPALAFMLHSARALGGYHRAYASLNDVTIILTRQRLAAAHARIDRREPLNMYEFDLVHGLTGLALYHLHAQPDHPVSRELVAYLTRITEPLNGNITSPPWWLHSGLGGTPAADFPHGHGNIGTAHGTSAIIATLAYAILHGHDTPTAHAALAALCGWTDQHRQDDPGATWWPGYVVPDAGPKRHRPSWCYGTPGIARAQQLAGLAQHDSTRQQQAENAMLAELTDTRQRERLPEVGLCHGKAGLLQSACRMAADSTDPHRKAQLTAEIPGLAAELASQLDADTHIEPELMNGTAGAALALHTATTGAPATGWDTFLALS